MCFSATASYTASAALLLTSIVTLSKANTRQRMLAAMPLLFAIQQFIEGTSWQALNQGIQTQTSTYAYLFFVFVVWPLWIPVSIRSLCTNKRETKQLTIPILSGLVVALFAVVYLWYVTPKAFITCNSIRYIADLPSYVWIIGSIFYLIATITPFFIIKRKYFWLMGSTLAISYIASFLFYYQTMLSVWCFFAAFLSIFTLLIVW